MTPRESLLVFAALALLAALISFWRFYGAPADEPPAVPTPTLQVIVLPATPLPTPAPTMTALVVPERLLLTPTATRVPPLLVLPATETPTSEPPPELTPTVVQRG